MKFNEKLLKLRKEKGLSQEELGMEMQVSRQTVSKWEAGQSYPDFTRLVMLSDFFDMTLDELVKDIDVQEVRENSFTNEKIDTKIFTANNFLRGMAGAVAGFLGAFLLDRMETAYCMIMVGVIFAMLMILVTKFMKSRVGLKPEEYSKEETKYDKMKEIV